MPTYVKADDKTIKLAAEVMAEHHRDLADAGVTVQIVVAVAKLDKDSEPTGPALKHGGYPAIATVRIVKHKERVQGMADAEIVLDGDRWAFLSHARQVAILDHELTHLVVVTDERAGRADEVIKRDDGGRPRLKMRLHDYQHGWFTEVAARHGAESIEVEQARTLIDQNGQVYFSFLEKPITKVA